MIEMTTKTPPASSIDDLARIFRALGDPSRLAIYEVIRRGCADGAAHSDEEMRRSIGEIAAEFNLSLSTVSHHIKELRTAGLISCERRGQHIFCSVDTDTQALAERFLGSAE
jgi:DNA-binding transcriptional ArsR family regulator